MRIRITVWLLTLWRLFGCQCRTCLEARFITAHRHNHMKVVGTMRSGFFQVGQAGGPQ